jgi:rhamnogalacturonan acetylesterase
MRTPSLSRALRFLLCAFVCLATAAGLRAQDDARPVVDDKTVPKEAAANPALPTLFIAGDSTLKSNAPLRGWGQEIGQFFDPAKINVVNRAIGGRSSRTFQAEGKWDAIVAGLKPGDFVLVQFGHNDSGRYDDPAAKGRPSLKGEDDTTAQVTRPDGTIETVHTFGWYMRKYGSDAKAKGALAVFCSMVPHKNWNNGKIVRGERDSLVKWTADAARATGAAYIDLNELVAREYERLGQPAVEPLFGDKGTHTTPAGAQLNARLVVSGLRALAGKPFDAYLSPQGLAIAPTAPEFVADASPAK